MSNRYRRFTPYPSSSSSSSLPMQQQIEEAERAKEEKYRHMPLKVSHANRKLWLVKTPQFMHDKWQSSGAFKDDMLLGRTTIEQADPAPHMTFESDFEKSAEGHLLPRHFRLERTKDAPTLYIMSRDKAGNLAVEGTVDYDLQMVPVDCDELKQLVRRTTERTTSSRTVQVMEERDVQQAFKRPVEKNIVASSEKKRKEEVKEANMLNKREKMDAGALEKLIFELFEKRPYWSTKELNDETRQPLQYLKEFLTKLCVYNSAGVNRGSYELKPEYKTM